MRENRYLKRIKQHDRLIIYGTGKVGREAYQNLCEMGMKEKIICFTVSDSSKKEQTVLGLPVKNISALTEEYDQALFLVAVGERLQEEISRNLREKKVRHYFDARKLYSYSYGYSDSRLKMRKIRDKIYCHIQERGMNRHPRAVHITYCRINNAGDTVLSYCVRKFLPISSWKIQTVSDEITNDTIEQINTTDMLIIGGGGLFLPDTNANSISGWQWAISEEQLNQISVPVIVFSVGYNYFKGQENSELFIKSVNALVRKACFVGLRNRGSVQAIQQILEPELRDKVVYQPCTTTLIRKMIPFKKHINTKKVGVNIAFDREERRYGDKKEEIMTQIARAIHEISEQGYKICYIAHCDSDLKFLKYLTKEDVNFTVNNLTSALPGKVISCYRDMEIVIGMRGHAQMIPFGVGCRIISLGTHDKTRWFLEDIKLEEWHIDMKTARGGGTIIY